MGVTAIHIINSHSLELLFYHGLLMGPSEIIHEYTLNLIFSEIVTELAGFGPWLPHEKSLQNPSFSIHYQCSLVHHEASSLFLLSDPKSGCAQLCLCTVSQPWAQRLISFPCNTFISQWESREPASVFSESPEKPEKPLKSLEFTNTCEGEGIGLRATVLCWQPSSNKSPSPNLLQLPTAQPGLRQGMLD